MCLSREHLSIANIYEGCTIDISAQCGGGASQHPDIPGTQSKWKVNRDILP